MGSEVSLHGSRAQAPMSAMGQKQTLSDISAMSALPPKADMTRFHIDVPESVYSALIESITC
jgi:hypothetical protein